MKRYIILLIAFTSIVALGAKGQEWQVQVPTGVRYKEATQELRQQVVSTLESKFVKDGPKFTIDLFTDPVVAGPGLWNDLQIECPVKNPPKREVIFQIKMHGIPIMLEGKGFLASEAQRLLLSLNKYVKGQTFVVRPPTSRELSLYWRLIPYDLEAPIVILDSKKFTFLLDYQGKSTIGFIEQLRPGISDLKDDAWQ